jgi:small nuclear ribonucleoprotein (snRNP)-like protein
LARRVVVNLKSGRAVSGLLVRRSGDLLFIRDAVALEPGRNLRRRTGKLS